jgi:hypothetical protein
MMYDMVWYGIAWYDRMSYDLFIQSFTNFRGWESFPGLLPYFVLYFRSYYFTYRTTITRSSGMILFTYFPYISHVFEVNLM